MEDRANIIVMVKNVRIEEAEPPKMTWRQRISEWYIRGCTIAMTCLIMRMIFEVIRAIV